MLGLKNNEGTNEKQNRRRTFNIQRPTSKEMGRPSVQNYFLGWTANVQAKVRGWGDTNEEFRMQNEELQEDGRGMAMPQSACCAGKQGRSATLPTTKAAVKPSKAW